VHPKRVRTGVIKSPPVEHWQPESARSEPNQGEDDARVLTLPVLYGNIQRLNIAINQKQHFKYKKASCPFSAL
jgi:hypothetical protein